MNETGKEKPGYGFFEQPVMFDWHEETKAVVDALSMPVAGGEPEDSLHGFRWLVVNETTQVPAGPGLGVGFDPAGVGQH